ncbi:MAG: PHB depolymerase family esterase [Gemmatimonadaceae bacterium]
MTLGVIASSFAFACSADSVVSPDITSGFDIGTGLHGINAGSLNREYVLHVPKLRPMTSSGVLLGYPLMIVLHGSSGSGEDIRATTNMDSVSEANRTIVAYPNAVGGAGGLFPTDWNAGTCCGAAAREGIDDVGFIKAVIAEISAKMPIDKNRLFVAGFSDGGRMAYRLACELSTQIAAIGVVSGSLKVDDCAPAKSVAIVAIHGTDDPVVPFDDDADTQPSTTMSDMAETMPPSVQFWISANGCSQGSASSFTDRVDLTAFRPCSGSDIAFYAINGGVHSWPILVSVTDGDPDQAFSATAVIADFFRHHRLK